VENVLNSFSNIESYSYILFRIHPVYILFQLERDLQFSKIIMSALSSPISPISSSSYPSSPMDAYSSSKSDSPSRSALSLSTKELGSPTSASSSLGKSPTDDELAHPTNSLSPTSLEKLMPNDSETQKENEAADLSGIPSLPPSPSASLAADEGGYDSQLIEEYKRDQAAAEKDKAAAGAALKAQGLDPTTEEARAVKDANDPTEEKEANDYMYGSDYEDPTAESDAEGSTGAYSPEEGAYSGSESTPSSPSGLAYAEDSAY
jgi:hypothetical protein